MEERVVELEDSESSRRELDIAKLELEELQLTRDSMLRQQPRVQWLRNGEGNTRFCLSGN